MNNEDTSFDLGVNLTDTGSIAHTESAGQGALDALDNYAQGKGGATGRALKFVSDLAKHNDLPKMTEAYSVVKPKGWNNPTLDLSVTFFEGLNVGVETPNYSEFMKKLSPMVLPSVTAGVLHSEQVSWEAYMSLFAIQASSGVANLHNRVIKETFKINIGKYFSCGGGYWLTGAKVSSKNMFGPDGKPVIWTIDFTFTYYKQITAKEWNEFFV